MRKPAIPLINRHSFWCSQTSWKPLRRQRCTKMQFRGIWFQFSKTCLQISHSMTVRTDKAVPDSRRGRWVTPLPTARLHVWHIADVNPSNSMGRLRWLIPAGDVPMSSGQEVAERQTNPWYKLEQFYASQEPPSVSFWGSPECHACLLPQTCDFFLFSFFSPTSKLWKPKLLCINMHFCWIVTFRTQKES